MKLDDLTAFQYELQKVDNEITAISFDIQNAEQFVGNTNLFYNSKQDQRNRLESIGLYDKFDIDETICPFCKGHLQEELIPSIKAIKESISKLDDSLSAFTSERPKLSKYISEKKLQLEKLKKSKIAIQIKINAIYENNDEALKARDINARKAKVIGRISLWVESFQQINEDNSILLTLEKNKKRLSEIDSLLDKSIEKSKIESFVRKINYSLTEWAKELDLEHSEFPYGYDFNKVTVVVDKDPPATLSQLGSGSNWLGIHIITLLAFQNK